MAIEANRSSDDVFFFWLTEPLRDEWNDNAQALTAHHDDSVQHMGKLPCTHQYFKVDITHSFCPAHKAAEEDEMFSL